MEVKNTTEIVNLVKAMINAAQADPNKKSEVYQKSKQLAQVMTKAKAQTENQKLTIDDIDNLCLDVFGQQLYAALKG
jgi:hypothetical protein